MEVVEDSLHGSEVRFGAHGELAQKRVEGFGGTCVAGVQLELGLAGLLGNKVGQLPDFGAQVELVKRQDVQRGGHGAKEGGEQGRYVLRFGEQEEARALEGAILQ